MQNFLFRGTGTALVTPFGNDGGVDYGALRRLIDFQIEGGVEAIVVLGTTGENPTVSDEERKRIVGMAVEQAHGRVPIIAGTGVNDTAASVRHARSAAALGADGQLVVGPYYNKPTQEGFRAHVHEIAAATDLPIILYNVPGRTGFNATPETIIGTAGEIPSVVGVKEASGSLAQISDILRGRPESLALYAGDDEMALPVAMLGGDGVVSVISNVLPGAFSQLVRHALAGDLEQARREHFELLPAMRACFIETNPIPVKAVLADLGLIENHLRLPLLPLSEGRRASVLEAFESLLAHAV